MIYAFGLGLAMPIMSIATLDLFPAVRGLTISLLTFVQMLVFCLSYGAIAPLVFDSATGLTGVVVASFMLAYSCWVTSVHIAQRQYKAF